MKLCRFKHHSSDVARIGLLSDPTTILDLTPGGITRLSTLLEEENPSATIRGINHADLPSLPVSEVKLLAPVEQQEVWAAGVTYLRSRKARMEESEFSANAYDRVYSAERPELFFKSLPEKVVAHGESVGIRHDSRWNVPEPELALVLNSQGKIVGCTIGNDMSSRDIEGENLLYLPQAKTYSRSCALGPWIVLNASEEQARGWKVALQVRRAGEIVFEGETDVGNIVRSFDELAQFLFRCQTFPNGAVLLTGTGIVPPDTFTLAEDDEVSIHVSGIGTLQNDVVIIR